MNDRTYIRDGRAPVPLSEVTSKVMSANKDKNTKPELILRKELWRQGVRGYRLHWKKAPGRPDLAFPGNKVAVFVNGCYWHRCPYCALPLPKSNQKFWADKFNNNIRRDKKKVDQLQKTGWKVMTVWECQLQNNDVKCVDKIKKMLNSI